MTTYPAHQQPLSSATSGIRSTVWWGMAMLLIIEAALHGSLVFSYFYLRGVVPEWPPAGIPIPPLPVPVASVVVLLASAAAIYWAESGIRAGSRARLAFGLAVATALAIVFLVLLGVDYAGKGFDWRINAYGSIVWALGVYQAVHVGMLLLLGAALLVLALRGHFTAQHHMAVQATAMFWYFIVAMWLPFFATLYLAPRMI